jgi:hypothetical protein
MTNITSSLLSCVSALAFVLLQIERYVLALPVQTEGEFIEGAQRRLERPRSCLEFGPIAPPWGTHG